MTSEKLIEYVARESANSCSRALSFDEAKILVNIASQTIKVGCSVYLFREGEKCVFPDNDVTNALPLSAKEVQNLFSYHLVSDNASGEGCVVTSTGMEIISKAWEMVNND